MQIDQSIQLGSSEVNKLTFLVYYNNQSYITS